VEPSVLVFWSAVIAGWRLWRFGIAWRRERRSADSHIVFTDQQGAAAPPNAIPASIADLRDAVTGQPLSSVIGLSRCTACHVFYQNGSVDFLRRENGGRCVACGDTAISRVDGFGDVRQDGRNHEPGVTTLADYRAKVGQIVVFEGRCVAVKASMRGTGFAVMFETGGWTRGFKMVIRTASVDSVGGEQFIWGLAGKRIRVRGLIANHPRYGYEIVVNDPAMILGAWT